MKYAIKKGDRYLTAHDGWTKDICKADLLSKKDAYFDLKEYPKLLNNCVVIPIQETYTRKEVTQG